MIRRGRAALLAGGFGALLLIGCSGGSAGSDVARPTVTREVDRASGRVEFAPVLQVEAAGAASAGPKGCPAPGGSASPAGRVRPSADGTLCYTLGPSAGDGSDLEVRNILVQAGTWVVQVEAVGPGRRSLGTLFDSCFEGRAGCPGDPGAVAILLDDVVVSAPDVQAGGLAEEPFVIATLDEVEAGRLAAAIGG